MFIVGLDEGAPAAPAGIRSERGQSFGVFTDTTDWSGCF